MVIDAIPRFPFTVVVKKRSDIPTAEFRETARRLAETCLAEQVILFGSQATGRGRPDSDVDLALILPDAADVRGSLQAAHRLLWPRRFAVDLVAIPASKWQARASLLIRQIAAQGVVLYDRRTA